jgi:hypothetical protein
MIAQQRDFISRVASSQVKNSLNKHDLKLDEKRPTSTHSAFIDDKVSGDRCLLREHRPNSQTHSHLAIFFKK